MRVRHLLITTDFSELARSVYAAGAALGREFGARVHLVHVVDPLPPHAYISREHLTPSSLPAGSWYAGAAEHLEEEARRSEFAGLEVSPRLLVEALPHQAIAQYVQEADIDLIVAATHGRGGLGHAILGSFVERLVQTSEVPILTLRAQESAHPEVRPTRVLVPFDFSDNARAVFPIVKEIYDRFQPKIEFVFVSDPSPPMEPYGGGSMAFDVDFAASAESAFAEARKEGLEGVEATFEVIEGRPHAEIVRAAGQRNSDLIVLSTHGLTGVRHFLLGSNAERVVRKAPCSVLTIRPVEIAEKPSVTAEKESASG